MRLFVASVGDNFYWSGVTPGVPVDVYALSVLGRQVAQLVLQGLYRSLGEVLVFTLWHQ